MRLKSSEALTLKAALKKTIRDATNAADAGREDKIDGGVDADADAEATRDDFNIGNILDVSCFPWPYNSKPRIYSDTEGPIHVSASFFYMDHAQALILVPYQGPPVSRL